MLRRLAICVSMGGLFACGEPGDGARSAAPARQGAVSGEEVSEVLPLLPDPSAVFATFMDAETGFMTEAVFDADREVVAFDVERGTIIDAATGEAAGGWSVSDAELDWAGSGVPFRVRFGTENGDRRAYFTERGPGTICNLRFLGGGALLISGTNQIPPNP
jgi:hypothetical protein